MEPASDLPVMVLRPLAGNSPPSHNVMQQFLFPHLSVLQTVWWCIWCAVLVYLIVAYIVVPLVRPRGSPTLMLPKDLSSDT